MLAFLKRTRSAFTLKFILLTRALLFWKSIFSILYRNFTRGPTCACLSIIYCCFGLLDYNHKNVLTNPSSSFFCHSWVFAAHVFFAMILWLKSITQLELERGEKLIYVQNQSIIINNEFIFRPLRQQIKSFNFNSLSMSCLKT